MGGNNGKEENHQITWEEFVRQASEVPDKAGKVLETMNQEQVEVMMAFVLHTYDVVYNAIAMNFDTDDGFVRQLPEEDRRTLVDVCDDLQSAFVDGLRRFAAKDG